MTNDLNLLIVVISFFDNLDSLKSSVGIFLLVRVKFFILI